MNAQDFGRKVHRLRRERGMSQVDLGGGSYTGSYISYLENDRRRPTPQVAEFLAERLGVSTSDLGFSQQDTSEVDLQVTQLLMQAERALDGRDIEMAVSAATDASERAQRADRRWEALHLKARALEADMVFNQAADLSLQLADDPAVRRSGPLRAEALVIGCRSLRALGRLTESVSAGQRALSYVEGTPNLEVWALLQLVAAMAELGESPSVLAPYARRLEAGRVTLPSGHLRGRVAWTLGSLAYLAQKPSEGERYYVEAVSLISREVDLTLWGRLHRAIASARLDRDDDTAVHEELRRARQALEFTGRVSDLVELSVDEARLAFLQGRLDEAEATVRRCLAHSVMSIPFVGRANARELLGRVLRRRGRWAEAREAYVGAARDFEEMGATAKALSTWRAAATIPG